ncbi:MAG: T9SS type A sorting domain-containing protein [Bacteroidia bacterium]
MTKHLIIFFVLFFTSLINAQTIFLPNIGTKWHYAFGNHVTFNTTNHKIEYIADSISILTGETIKKLISTKIYANDNSSNNKKILIKQRNDSIWFKHFATNSWQLLYNFNALVGQGWTFSVMSGTFVNTHTVTVNSVYTATINSQNLKALNVTCKYGTSTYTTTIYERIGAMVFLFNTVDYYPSFVIDGAYVNDLLCYEDSTFGLKQFTAYPCDYSYYVGLNERGLVTNNISVFPNPATDILNLESNVELIENSQIKIIDVLGQKVFESQYKNKIDISELKKGIYFLQVFDKEKLILTEKIIKE